MAFSFHGCTIGKIGVVGSGQIGPDIALHFVKVLHRYGTQVVVVDIAEEALKNGKAKFHRKVDKGVETGAFKPEEAAVMKSRVNFTSNYDGLKDADLVVEAATEDLPLKQRIFKQVEDLVSSHAIFASSSSHFEPERIFEQLRHKGRALCAHYFFPAERNTAVEIIPGKDTEPSTTEFIMRFFETVGKMPIKIGSRYGYAVDPVFEGLILASVQLVDAGLGDSKQVDYVASKCLGMTVGPLTALNLTGADSIIAHGLAEMHERLNPWFRVPERFKLMEDAKTAWEVPARGEAVDIPQDKEEAIRNELLAAYFGIVCDILDSGIITVSDFDLLVGTALDMKPPFGLMNSIGVDKALELVESYSKKYPDMPVAESLKAQAASGRPWELLDVLLDKKGDVAVLTIRRPKALNALSSKVFAELTRHCEVIRNDPSMKAVVITGFGNKAFVAGADIKEMARFTKPAEGEAFAIRGQKAFAELEKVGKPVVAAMNGIALGGGCELTIWCTARLGLKGLGLCAGQAEVNLGLIPGWGGTQRLPRLIGFEKAAEMVRRGKPISSAQALDCGLINEQVEGDVLPRAIELARELAEGTATVKLIDRGPVAGAPESLPDLDIGHLSRAIDRLAVQAIVAGGKMTLEDGLKNEARLFGQCWTTEDTRIGLLNFIENGPRSKAVFVHR